MIPIRKGFGYSWELFLHFAWFVFSCHCQFTSGKLRKVIVCTNTIKETFLLVWEFFWVLCCPHIFCSDRPTFAAGNSLDCGGVLLFPSLPPLFPHRLRSLFHFIGRQRENQVVPPGLPSHRAFKSLRSQWWAENR